MKYKIVNGKKYFVDTKGEVMNDQAGQPVEVPTAVESAVEEYTETAPAPTPEDAEAVEDLKKFFSEMGTKAAIDAAKSLDLVSNMDKSIAAAFAAQFKEKGVKTNLDVEATMKGLKNVRATQGTSFDIEVKTLSELSSLTGEVILEDRQAGIERAPVRVPFIQNLADNGTTNSKRVTWTEVTTETGAPATTAELDAFSAKDYNFEVFGTDVYKIAVHSKYSMEILEDAPELVTAVKNMLQEDLALVLDEKLYSGAGVGDFKGIRTYAVAFAAGSLVVPTPNRLDVLRAAISQVHKTGKGKFMVTDILMNPEDVAALDLAKGSDGHYIMPPFSTADRTTVKGVRIVENTLVTVGDFLVGDFRKLHIRINRGTSIQVATENADDFIKDLCTIRVTVRGAIYVKNNDNAAFVKGTFATAITDLTS